jgi:hemolysin III
MRTRRKQLFGEELANSISHGIMAIFGIFVLVFLLVKSDTLSKTFGAIIFGLSVTALYTFSTLYHVWMNESFKNKILKRFDHISIYLLIGGTYAPILLNLTTITSIPSFIPNISVGLLFFIVQ